MTPTISDFSSISHSRAVIVHDSCSISNISTISILHRGNGDRTIEQAVFTSSIVNSVDNDSENILHSLDVNESVGASVERTVEPSIFQDNLIVASGKTCNPSTIGFPSSTTVNREHQLSIQIVGMTRNLNSTVRAIFADGIVNNFDIECHVERLVRNKQDSIDRTSGVEVNDLNSVVVLRQSTPLVARHVNVTIGPRTRQSQTIVVVNARNTVRSHNIDTTSTRQVERTVAAVVRCNHKHRLNECAVKYNCILSIGSTMIIRLEVNCVRTSIETSEQTSSIGIEIGVTRFQIEITRNYTIKRNGNCTILVCCTHEVRGSCNIGDNRNVAVQTDGVFNLISTCCSFVHSKDGVNLIVIIAITIEACESSSISRQVIGAIILIIVCVMSIIVICTTFIQIVRIISARRIHRNRTCTDSRTIMVRSMSHCECIRRNRGIQIKRIILSIALELFVDLADEIIGTIFLNEKNTISREGIHNARRIVTILIQHIVIVVVRIDNSKDIVSGIATVTVSDGKVVGVNMERSIRNGIHVRTSTIMIVSNQPLISTISQAVKYKSSSSNAYN